VPITRPIDDAEDFAHRLHYALERRLPKDEIFIDVKSLKPGSDFAEEIKQKLQLLVSVG
jgi:hypothetical protein